MEQIVDLIDRVLNAPDDESVQAQVRSEVHALMAGRPLFAW